MTADEYTVTGCLDGYCHITGERTGQHTNGGCNCLRGLEPRIRRNVEKSFYRLRNKIDELESKLEKASNTIGRGGM